MITQVTPQIFIGNSQDSIQATKDQFDAVLNVAIDFDLMDGFKYRHKVGLLDGPGNHPDTFMAAIVLLHSLVVGGKRVLVHCHEGKSRSVMVASTYIAARGDIPLDDVLTKIMALRNIDIYREALYNVAQMVIPKLKEIVSNTYAKE